VNGVRSVQLMMRSGSLTRCINPVCWERRGDLLIPDNLAGRAQATQPPYRCRLDVERQCAFILQTPPVRSMIAFMAADWEP
jgi:hypothetical protein